MKILVLGGTRFFGVHMVKQLLSHEHQVTIATRNLTPDSFGNQVSRITLERTSAQSMKQTLSDQYYDIVIDKLAYCSNDIKSALDIINCDKYIHMSSTSIYNPKHVNTFEQEFDPFGKELIWCARDAFPYDEIKRQAECALWQAYGDRKAIAVRYPFVLGKDDYTKRLLFYVTHILLKQPMYIDNLDCQMSFIRSDEAGYFMAFLAESNYIGAINGASNGTISIQEIISYVEQKTGIKAIISRDGEAAPYNEEPEYSINTDTAASLGYKFSNLKDWIYPLIDFYIETEQ